MKEAQFSYIGLANDGSLELVISDRQLSPCGNRLLRNNDFAKGVREFYLEPVTEQTCKNAIRALTAFLRNEEFVPESLTFAVDQLPKVPRKKS